MNVKFKFCLGDLVRDKVTKFSGVVTGATVWFNGCKRYAVQSQKLPKDGTVPEAVWFDEQQIELTTKHFLLPAASLAEEGILKSTGGPQKDPKRSF